jgi:hypothetical protein
MKEYDATFEPVLDFYNRKGLLYSITEDNLTIPEIYSRLREYLLKSNRHLCRFAEPSLLPKTKADDCDDRTTSQIKRSLVGRNSANSTNLINVGR